MNVNQIIEYAEKQNYTMRKNGRKIVVTFPGSNKEYQYTGTICDVAQRLGIITEDERTETRYNDGRHNDVWVAWVMRANDEHGDVIYHKDQYNIEGIQWYRDYQAQYAGRKAEQLKMYQNGERTYIAH